MYLCGDYWLARARASIAAAVVALETEMIASMRFVL
jgi:hypothetical protein